MQVSCVHVHRRRQVGYSSTRRCDFCSECVCVSAFSGVDCVAWFVCALNTRVNESAHLGVKCRSTYRFLFFFVGFVSSLLCVCVCVYTVGKWAGPLRSDTPPPPPPPCPLCLQALLAPACLSIFVTSLKFDVSFFLLTASEPCMNELVIYTKCLIKSAAAPGINIVERLGIFAVKGARDCSKTSGCLRYEIKPSWLGGSWSVTLPLPDKRKCAFCMSVYLFKSIISTALCSRRNPLTSGRLHSFAVCVYLRGAGVCFWALQMLMESLIACT